MTPEERRRDRGQPSHARPSDTTVIPPLHQGHELFEKAREIAGFRSGYKHYKHPYYDDVISEIVLALLEGADPVEARKRVLFDEKRWREVLRIWPEAEVHDGRLVVQGKPSAD